MQEQLGVPATLVNGLILGLAFARPVSADVVQLLDDPRESLLVRSDLVSCASSEVLVQSFIFGDDRLTLGSLAQLRAAVRRGVTVRVLTDAQWSAIPPAVETHLLAEGVQIREFHPFRLDRLHWVVRRMHDKTLVVDGRRLLLGGRNVQAPYFGHGEQIKRRDYLDTDLELDGKTAGAARAHFLALWDSGHVREVRNAVFPQDVERAALKLDEAEAWLRERLAEYRNDPALTPPAPVDVESARFVHDVAGAKTSRPGVADEMLALLASAKESVVVESPYLVPSRSLRRALRRAGERGVAVSILTNSLATTDNLWPQAAYAGDKKPLIRRGIEIYECRGPESHHAKTAVFDERTCVIGSFNLDPRSEKLNTEVAVVIDSRELAQQLLAVTRARQAASWRIGRDGRPVGETERYPGVSKQKIIRMRLRRLIVPLLRGQL